MKYEKMKNEKYKKRNRVGLFLELGIKLRFVVWIVETKPRFVHGKLFHEVFFSSFLAFIRILSFFFASFKLFF